MKILQVTYTQKDFKNRTFKGSDHFEPIKKLPKMICASCGKPTLDINLYIKTLIPICKPLSKVIELGTFDTKFQYKYPLIIAKLTEFAKLYPDKSIDEILETQDGTYAELKRSVVQTFDIESIKNNTPERFSLDRKINSLFFDVLEKSRSKMKSSSAVMKQLMKLKDYLEGFNEARKQAFIQLEIYTRKYPRKTLAEIIQIPKIANFHKMKNLLQRTEARELLDYHFENIRNLIKKKNPDALDYFDNLKTKVLDLYENEPDEKARKYISKSLYRKALSEYHCQDIEDAVLNELSQIPTSFTTKDSFFASAAINNFSDIEIVNSFFKDFITSEDHVTAISQGGRDYSGNKLIMHTICNNHRASKPYAVYLNYHPEMALHAKEQIDYISKSLLAQKLPDNLRTYPIRITDTLRIVSEEKIQPDIIGYCEKILKQSQKRVKKNKEIIKQLSQSSKKSIEEIKVLKEQNNEELAFQAKLESYLNRYKKST